MFPGRARPKNGLGVGCGADRLQHSEERFAWIDWIWESFQGALPVEQISELLAPDRSTYERSSRRMGLLPARPYDES